MDRRAFLPINRTDPEGFLSERNELLMYQCFSGKLSFHEVAPTDGIGVVQYYASWSGDEQTKIGHRSNDAHDHKIIIALRGEGTDRNDWGRGER
jgi:hypothetical protein